MEVLLVEDNANDEMLALYSLRDLIAAKKIQVVRDGAEALDYAFSTGTFAGRVPGHPQVILLDKNLPEVDGLEVLRRLRRSAHLPDSDRDDDGIGQGKRHHRELRAGHQ